MNKQAHTVLCRQENEMNRAKIPPPVFRFAKSKEVADDHLNRLPAHWRSIVKSAAKAFAKAVERAERYRTNQ